MNNLNRLQQLLKTIDKNKTYYNVHAGDIVGCFFLIVIFLLSFLYLSIKKRNVIIRKEWDIHKCKPEVSPFAGLINAPPGSTFAEKMEYTKQNYKECNVGILESNMKMFTTPLENSQGIIRYIFAMATATLMKIKNILLVIKNLIIKIIVRIFEKINQILVELQKIFFTIKDLLMKGTGVLQTVFFLIVAQAYTFISFLNSLIEAVVILLIILTVFTYLMFGMGTLLMAIPFMQVAAAAFYSTGAALLIAYLGMAIPMIIVIVFLAILNDHMKKQEDLTCFHPDTKVRIKDGTYKSMKDLHLGEILYDDDEVIAVLRIKGDKDNVYYKIYNEELNDYIYVTGTHYILDPKTKRYIFVEKYNNAVKTNNWTNEMSCLVTASHKIKLGEHTFTDWEDIF